MKIDRDNEGSRASAAGLTPGRDERGYAAPRIGQFEFLNGYPLYFGLERGQGWGCFDLVHGVPTALNRMLVEGRLDISPISSIEYAAHAGSLLLFPQLSITSDGAVDSIQLVSRKPIDRIESVALTSQSATSVVLLKILLEQKYDLSPEYRPLMAEPREALAENDAVLLIGDQALVACYMQDWDYSYDLGAQWKDFTGLPMVFALWAVRDDFYRERADEVREVEERLLYSVDYCRSNWDEVVKAAQPHYPFEPRLLYSYFSKLRYGFNDEYRRGLEEFYRRAVIAGAIAAVPELRFMDEERGPHV